MSLPKQCELWSDLKAAYRLLSNEKVDPAAMQAPHRALTRAACAAHPVVLLIQDKTEIDLTTRFRMTGVGQIGNGTRTGLIQHTTLAVVPDGLLLGLMDQHTFARIDVSPDETRTQKLERWQESDVWGDAARRIGAGPEGCRFVHVMDREGDCFTTIEACDTAGAGFLIRACRNRAVEDRSDLLFSWVKTLPVAGEKTVDVPASAGSRNTPPRAARTASLKIRYGEVELTPPLLRRSRFEPRRTFVVYACEENPPEGATPIDWVLLSSEPVASLADAERMMEWYAKRWTIEEWHRVLKEGCSLEATQLDEADDVRRLAAVISVVGVRMLQMRDMAGMGRRGEDPRSEDPAALKQFVPRTWRRVVAKLAGAKESALTPRLFWLTIAKKGGFLGRKGDGRPGWKVIWRGWQDISMMVLGAELMLDDPPRRSG